MKKTQKIITILMLIAILTMSLFISKVNAADATATVASPSEITITKNVTGVTNPVTNTFGYTIEADANNPATVTGFPSTASIAFSGVTPTSGTATQTTKIDFANAKFTKVGDYKFKITETSSEDATNYPTDSSYYYLYVSVRFDADDTNGTKMTAKVLTSGMKNTTNDPTEQTKVPVIFTTEPKFTYITITKTVSGNMGDKSEYFNISVNIPGSGKYLVSGGKYGEASSSKTTVTAGTASALEIKHGETLTIGIASDGKKQIPVNSKYTVSETAVEGYNTTIDEAKTNSVEKTTAEIPENNQLPASNKVSILNNYDVATLTGVFFNVMPYVVIALAVIILIAMVRRSSKKKEE